jgi:large subunit ribosomal protein L29
MKSDEFLKSLKGKTEADLREELVALRKEAFSLRMQAGVNQLPKNHLIRDVRKKIARLRTVMQQQAKAS